MELPEGAAGLRLPPEPNCVSSPSTLASAGGSLAHQLRHAHAVELAREGVAINIIQRQLGHTDLGTTSTYLQGIDPSEIIDAVRSRRQPTISATAGLTL